MKENSFQGEKSAKTMLLVLDSRHSEFPLVSYTPRIHFSVSTYKTLVDCRVFDAGDTIPVPLYDDKSL